MKWIRKWIINFGLAVISSVKGNRLAGLLVSTYILENDLFNIKNKEEKLFKINKKLENFH